MIDEQLELIYLITSSYKGNKLAAIQSCINSLETPSCVRNPTLQAVAANEAALDLMEQTRPQFYSAAITDIFSPDDHATGQAEKWIMDIAGMIQVGGGEMRARFWNGRDVLNGYIKSTMINEWFLASFIPESLVVLPPSGRPAVPRSPGRACTSSPPILQIVR